MPNYTLIVVADGEIRGCATVKDKKDATNIARALMNRKSIFKGKVNVYLACKADENKFEVIEMEIMPDHMHLLLEVDPQF